MSLFNIILKKGQIAVIQTASDKVVLDNSPYLQGEVANASDLSDMYAIGDVILFDASRATKFTISGGYYYLIEEDNIYSTFIL
jgi:hypothetical protein